MGDSDDSERVDSKRRTLLGASAIGLAGLAGAGSVAAQSDEQHDHSGQRGGTARLGEAAPVESITVSDLRARGTPVHDVRAYGAVGDGETDDSAAIQAALDATDDGDVVYFPPGAYVASTQFTQSGKSLAVVGEGPGVSEVRFTEAPGGFDIDLPRPRGPGGEPTGEPAGNATVSNLSLITTVQGGGTAIDLSWPHVDSLLYLHAIVQNVELIGHQRSVTGWTNGVVVDESWHTLLDTVDFVGAGQGVSEYAVVLKGRSIANVLRQVISYHADGGVLLDGRTEGFRMRDSDFVATTYGLKVGPQNQGTPQLVVADTHANVARTALDLRRLHEPTVTGCDLWTWQWDDEAQQDPVIELRDTTNANVANNVLIGANTGVNLGNAENPTVSSNSIEVQGDGNGIDTSGASGVQVATNQIRIQGSGDGVVCASVENGQVQGNQIRGNTADTTAVDVTGSRLVSVTGNVARGTGRNVRFDGATTTSLAGLNVWQSFGLVETGAPVVDEGSGNLVAQNLANVPNAQDGGTTTTTSRAGETTGESTTTGETPTETETEESGGVAGFGVGAAAVGAAGAAMAVARRRRDD